MWDQCFFILTVPSRLNVLELQFWGRQLFWTKSLLGLNIFCAKALFFLFLSQRAKNLVWLNNFQDQRFFEKDKLETENLKNIAKILCSKPLLLLVSLLTKMPLLLKFDTKYKSYSLLVYKPKQFWSSSNICFTSNIFLVLIK